MPQAAIPDYLGNDFSSASPGMRYGMYLNIWNRQWEKAKSPGLNSVCRLNQQETALIGHINQRQQFHAKSIGDDAMLTVFGKSVSPFTTGLGNEHPLENGFAFLWPYGLPYLPGSGVKGVLRQATRELEGGEWGESDWTDETIATIKTKNSKVDLTTMDILFGKESQSGESEHFRGVLSFWDVIPHLADHALQVEVMTPHQKHYYQDGESPHDSGSPIPITFLTLPPESGFTFHVACDTTRLKQVAPSLLENNNEQAQWKALLQQAFTHAFDWLGFGAKTAVGYGSMEIDSEANTSPIQREASEWIDTHADRVKAENHMRSKEEAVASKPLAEIWQRIDKLELKQAVLEELKTRWHENGRAPSKKAVKIYEM